MIAILLSTLLAAADAPPRAAPPPPPAKPVHGNPPHERPVIEAQFAAPRPVGGPGISAAEADKLYGLYLSRIGQPSQDIGRDASPVAAGGAGAPQ